MDATHPIRDPTRGTLSGEPPPTPRTPRNARRWPRTRATTRRRENFSRLLPPLQRRPAPLDRPGSRDPTINLTHSLSLSAPPSHSISLHLSFSLSVFLSPCPPGIRWPLHPARNQPLSHTIASQRDTIFVVACLTLFVRRRARCLLFFPVLLLYPPPNCLSSRFEIGSLPFFDLAGYESGMRRGVVYR